MLIGIWYRHSVLLFYDFESWRFHIYFFDWLKTNLEFVVV
jgi:hypothetical protein